MKIKKLERGEQAVKDAIEANNSVLAEIITLRVVDRLTEIGQLKRPLLLKKDGAKFHLGGVSDGTLDRLVEIGTIKVYRLYDNSHNFYKYEEIERFVKGLKPRF